MTKMIKNDHKKAKSNLIVPPYLRATADNNVSPVFDKVEEKIAAVTRSETAEMLVDEIKEKSANTPSSYAEPNQDVVVSRRIDKYRLSFIEGYEEAEAIRQIEELLKFETPRVCGYFMVVKIYVRPEEIVTFKDDKGQEKSLYMPTQMSANDKFRNCTALVIAQGTECYTGRRFVDSLVRRLLTPIFGKWMRPLKKPWCKVGDWIVFPRNEGPQVNYRGIPVQIIPDDKCYMIIQDPTHVTRD